MDVACRFFWEVGLPAIERTFSSYVDRIAAGLVAAGSDCAGNDDEVSRDYDWGPRFQVYLNRFDFQEIGSSLQSKMDAIPSDFNGTRCNPSESRAICVYSIDGFFSEKTRNGFGTGFVQAPKSAMDWLKIPEHCLFEVTRGQVFYDPLGEFSERQQSFAAYYPDDAWLKRIAAAVVECGIFGSHLMQRSVDRDDYFTADMAWWKFAEAAMKLGFLLNRRYAPWQKWLYREFCKLPNLSPDVADMLWNGQCDANRRPQLVQRIENIYKARIKELGLIIASSDEASVSMSKLAEDVSAQISDPDVVNLAVWVDTIHI
jgi:hypothetical protein